MSNCRHDLAVAEEIRSREGSRPLLIFAVIIVIIMIVAFVTAFTIAPVTSIAFAAAIALATAIALGIVLMTALRFRSDRYTAAESFELEKLRCASYRASECAGSSLGRPRWGFRLSYIYGIIP